MMVHRDGSVSFTEWDAKAWEGMGEKARAAFGSVDDLATEVNKRADRLQKAHEEREYRDLLDEVTPSLAANMLGMTDPAALLAS